MEEIAFVPPRAKKDVYCSRRERVVTWTSERSRREMRWNMAAKMPITGTLAVLVWVSRIRTMRLWTVRIEAAHQLAI